MSEDRCVCCGEVIPEGRMVCPQCEPSCLRCANDGLDLPQCKECGPDNGYAWYRPKE